VRSSSNSLPYRCRVDRLEALISTPTTSEVGTGTQAARSAAAVRGESRSITSRRCLRALKSSRPWTTARCHQLRRCVWIVEWDEATTHLSLFAQPVADLHWSGRLARRSDQPHHVVLEEDDEGTFDDRLAVAQQQFGELPLVLRLSLVEVIFVIGAKHLDRPIVEEAQGLAAKQILPYPVGLFRWVQSAQALEDFRARVATRQEGQWVPERFHEKESHADLLGDHRHA
jgi:hypothetical protein